ncbi:Bug family tripartite tricarboxylate transporter substrate binding protein [Cupriavidus consociatus]|uniref:Bug family tripartite tricarboxylate transporter substrate binding protein n=1 Tax=Cupriavidus consociatus TaxID=2821357 RepID=UPI001AE34BFC|nr:MULTISPECIES: tripartite tricarboxylate transporter substrate binding protein [unclassified Cupriavidus]MBP0625114.1 tripartite tricarboxylate transporter substrate binding protein [Cupriavidus sp. LEh25]MDK2661854.1 tripartite tricarboxylate transporter substrate binding protein [Cupriavidus sp. LEh21]
MKKQANNFLWGGYALAFGVGAVGWLPVAQAQQAWPTKPIRLVVAGPAGGSADALARLLAEGLHKAWSKPVIVENKPGAAGALAISDMQSTGKDGHTLLVIQGGVVSEAPLAYKVHYKPFSDLKPLAQISRTGLVLVANKDLPVSNLKQLVDYGKSQKEGLVFASYAAGLKGHTSGILLGQLTHVPMRHVGYKGSPPALNDLMGGHVPLMFDGVTTSLPLIKAGKIKAIALAYPTRIAGLADVPTFKELGYPQLAQAGWFAVWSRPDVEPAVQQKVREATLAYFRQPGVQNRIKDMGMEQGDPATSEEMMTDLKQAYQQQVALLKSINYQPE